MFAIELMNIHEFNREKVLAIFDEKIEIREWLHDAARAGGTRRESPLVD